MIKYIPNMESLLWARKCQRTFETKEDLKRYIAEIWTSFFSYIGEHERVYSHHDVELLHFCDKDILTGWKNCHKVILDGRTIGMCGE